MKYFIACWALLIHLGTLAFAETSLAVIPTLTNGAGFKTRVVIGNLTSDEYSITATLYGPNGRVSQKIISMLPAHYRGWDNFLGSVFDYSGNGSVVLQFKKAMEDSDLISVARYTFYLTAEVYADSPNGRSSTTVVNGVAPSVDEGDRVYNFGISVNQDRRTNIGAFNPGDEPISIQAEVSDSSGLVETISFEMAPYSWQQKSISATVNFGWIQWETSGHAYLWAVGVDNRSNDGTLVYPVRLDESAGPPSEPREPPACTAETVLRSGNQCIVTSGDRQIGTFTVNRNGTSCLSIGGFTSCSGTSHNFRNAGVNQYRITFVAKKNADGSWTISEISVSG